ncbi:GNAT family N-acetyltransferase [Anaerorhabdus furcosa]|uniref:Acetyltransferase (GNAT) family protein n=1 Tax=Anaerorhabdus furcosa TaxID=118967 RepID=A0A1T4PDM3_9FIRM|nr:GNAT family N-acetyltransferase [Anaerorhabdus furcosa]SJZ89427.1 Acetyltransferase (GNAT) family protein [Anaerorhabdus furcosa]
MQYEIKEGMNYLQEVRELFIEYTQMLLDNDPDFKVYLTLQSFDKELEEIESKYGKPEGRLYVVLSQDRVVGCIALRKLSKDVCEMKRLYVRSEVRGQGIAGRLIDLLIEQARLIGYKTMVLDTIPALKSAIHLYKKKGFIQCDAYNNSPLETTIFMKRDII